MLLCNQINKKFCSPHGCVAIRTVDLIRWHREEGANTCCLLPPPKKVTECVRQGLRHSCWRHEQPPGPAEVHTSNFRLQASHDPGSEGTIRLRQFQGLLLPLCPGSLEEGASSWLTRGVQDRSRYAIRWSRRFALSFCPVQFVVGQLLNLLHLKFRTLTTSANTTRILGWMVAFRLLLGITMPQKAKEPTTMLKAGIRSWT